MCSWFVWNGAFLNTRVPLTGDTISCCFMYSSAAQVYGNEREYCCLQTNKFSTSKQLHKIVYYSLNVCFPTAINIKVASYCKTVPFILEQSYYWLYSNRILKRVRLNLIFVSGDFPLSLNISNVRQICQVFLPVRWNHRSRAALVTTFWWQVIFKMSL